MAPSEWLQLMLAEIARKREDLERARAEEKNVLWKIIDVEAIDGTVNGIAHGASAVGDTVRHTQSGNTRSYAVWVVVGALAIIIIIFWPALHPVLGTVTK